MMSKVSSSRVVTLHGLRKGRVRPLDTVCIRRNCFVGKVQRPNTPNLAASEVLGIVSHPSLINTYTARYVNAWCHPFKDKKFKRPNLLLSESDFIDVDHIPIINSQTKKYDFYYFTMGAEKQGIRKGVDLFVDILPDLCGKHNLKGVVINYTSPELWIPRPQKKIWRQHRGNIKYIHKKLTARQVASIMAQCRFGLFPNKNDCSPLMLAESLVRNVPVLVNQDIWGGWKYINDDTGLFFDRNTAGDQAMKLLDMKFNSQEWFMTHYGFHKSAARLAKFGRKHLKTFRGFSKVCFSGLARYLK